MVNKEKDNQRKGAAIQRGGGQDQGKEDVYNPQHRFANQQLVD